MASNKYKITIHNTEDLDPKYVDNCLREVLAYDITQIGNILNMLQYRGDCVVKEYSKYKDAMDDFRIFYEFGLTASLSRVANE